MPDEVNTQIEDTFLALPPLEHGLLSTFGCTRVDFSGYGVIVAWYNSSATVRNNASLNLFENDHNGSIQPARKPDFSFE